MRRIGYAAAAGLALAVLGAPAAGRTACTITIGVVMELTGPAGEYGQKASKSVELALKDLNEAGGAAGCTLEADIRDAQSQGAVAADVAKQLVEIKKVPVIIGGIISSVSMPVLTAVTAPSGVVQISPASSSPSFTNLAEQGKTGGWFFRTITSDALQGTIAAKYALDLGLKKLAVIHVNNDFGTNMVKEFAKAYQALGGTILQTVPYNENQPSYGPEVTRAMEGDPDALYLVSTPGDGATIARNWISQGGVRKFLLNDGMNSEEFIKNVGAQYLDEAYGTSSGVDKSPSTDYFAKAFQEYSGFDWQAPAADRTYDATAIAGLAIAKAGKPEPAAIRDSIRAVLDPDGTTVYAGPEGFRQALDLIKAGKPIRYVGVIGAVQFDRNGDITGPFRLWRIKDGQVVTTGEVKTDEVDALIAKVNG
ncbi:MAG: ABC transporter substrate-binding protein [Rhodospirillaceae bacterium]|nr:ABC transporter substrate-binding protein [Rhodospirillaceae bacterium]